VKLIIVIVKENKHKKERYKMKVFGKWLVMGIIDNKAQIVASFRTNKDAVEALELAGFKRLSDNLWEDSKENKFFVEKNIKEYRH
jgi:hypothetical protein